MKYTYRFIGKDNEVVYIGSTKNIKTRVSQHFSSGSHLPAEIKNEVERIEYIEFEDHNGVLYLSAENYFINKYRPKYNTRIIDVVFRDYEVEELENLEWTEFKRTTRRKMISKKDEWIIDVGGEDFKRIDIKREFEMDVKFSMSGRYNLFVGKNLGQIKFMTVCLQLADSALNHYSMNNKILPNKIHIKIKRNDLSVFKGIYGCNKRTFDSINKDIVHKKEDEFIFESKHDIEQDSIIFTVSTCLLRSKRTYKIMVNDILATISATTAMLKLKSYIDSGLGVRVLYEEFRLWIGGSDRVKQSVGRAILSLEKENGLKIVKSLTFADRCIEINFCLDNLGKNISANNKKIIDRCAEKGKKQRVIRYIGEDF